MFALDLFNTRYERDLREGAVDDLEARRIDDLNAKMDDLLARAREAKTPEHKAGLKREFEKVKNERDSYFKIKEQQTPSNIPPANKGIGDLQDPKQKMAQLQQKAKKGPLANVGAGLKAFFKGEPEPMDEEDLGASSGPRAYGVANFQRLVKANMGNIPTVTLEFAKPEDNIKLDQAGVDLISDYYDGLDSDQAKNHFIYRVLPSADEVRTVLKQLGWNSQIQQPLPGIPTQGELPLAEKKKFDNSSDLEAGDVKVARELQKLRAQYPAAKSDLEAVARAEIDSSERSQQQLAAIKGANEKQDALLKQLVSLDQEQGREIDDLDQENNTLEKRLAQVQSTNDRLQQAIGQMTGTKKSDSKTNQTKTNKSSTDNTDNAIDKVSPVVAPAPKEKPKSTPKVTPKPKKVNTKSAAIDSMARQIAGFNQPAPKLDATVVDKETDDEVNQRPSKLRALRSTQATNADEFKLTAESDIREQSNDDDWYDDEDQETELRSGDYVRDTQDGESGEIFRMQGDPYERRVRILDRDGKGWYIEPSRLTRVDPQDPDVQRYFGKQRVRDMDEQEQKPGFGEFPPKQEITIVPPKKLKSGETYQDQNKYWQSQGQAPIYKTNEDNDQVKRVFKDKAGKPVGEIGIDPESSPGNGEWYVHHYATGYSVVGFDSAAEAKRELLYVNKHPDAVEGHPSTKDQGMAEMDKSQKPPGRHGDYPLGAKGTTVKPVAAKKVVKDLAMDLDQAFAKEFAKEKQVKKKGVAEGATQLSVQQLATISDEALDNAYHYGRSQPGNTFGWQANLKSASFAKQMIDKGVTDIEAISDAIHKGWNVTAQAFVKNPQMFDDSKTMSPEKLQAKIAQRQKLMTQNYAQLPEDEKEKDRVVARAMLQAIKGQQGVAESAKSGEYYVHTVYFKDGTKKRIRVTSDEFDVADYYTKRGQAVDRVDYDFQLHSDMTEAEKEPTTRQELLNRVDKIQRMMTQERNPANLQILRKELEMLKQRYQHLREDNDSAAVERAILNRIMVAHTDLLMKYGPDKVMQAAEEVAYNVGDVDEIGTSDVSAYVAQVKQILGVPEELDEKWSQKYKSSINCAAPKGFSQRAHCAGKKK
jgi:hypothetical protein